MIALKQHEQKNFEDEKASEIYARDFDPNKDETANSSNVGDSETDDSDDDDDYGPSPVAGVWAGSQNLIEIAENGIFEPSSFITIGPVDSQIFLRLCEYWLIFGDFSIHFRGKVQRLRPVTSLQPWAVKPKVNPF